MAYNGISQTTSINPIGATPTEYSYAGVGQAERTRSRAPADLGLPSLADTKALHGMLGLATETTAGATTSYVRDANGSLIAERTPSGDFYYVFDGQGSVIALVDPSGTQRAAYSYDPYGAHATATEMNGALPPNPWRWNASYLDATGLYKMGARYYDPMLGRFTQVDPVAGGSANDYDYAFGDPINWSDLDGEWPHRRKKQSTGKSGEGKHVKGEKRVGVDRPGGEKGDLRREYPPKSFGGKRREKRGNASLVLENAPTNFGSPPASGLVSPDGGRLSNSTGTLICPNAGTWVYYCG